MEKYLRLLNPKTTNFDAVGGGSYDALTAQDICSAISYAELSPIQSILFRLYSSSLTLESDLHKSVQVILMLIGTSKIERLSDHELSLYIALVEIFKCPSTYKPSVRNRAIIGSVSKDRMHRGLSTVVNSYRELLDREINHAALKIRNQLLK